MPVHLPPGGPVADRPHAQPVQRMESPVNVGGLRLGGDSLHRLVQVAVVGDLVPAVRDLPHHVGIGVGGEAGDAERRRDLLPLQQPEQAGHAHARPVRLVVMRDMREAAAGSWASAQDSASTSKEKAAAARLPSGQRKLMPAPRGLSR